ncbi:molecular chaperone [Providencia burhodogranariea]|uniref:Putative pili assembly chaperone n=1 Tax=Providencia burhodogranariea DSM 19968 TaxID=1141662 RepID=K8WN91_9GAMM|nr:molecular chaperone [Providencia burhodogranariea]EKT62034.1 putative pili assembly chaperone [Providencia burhodogranariea DSM 19968]
MALHKIVFVLIVALFTGGIHAVHAATPNDSEGIVLESTRVIYPSKAKNGITFTVTNRTSQVYLLQSRVLPWVSSSSITIKSGSLKQEPQIEIDSEKSIDVALTPFIVLPPLTRFAPEDEMTLRIRLTQNTLPNDRESIFMLALKAIPGQSMPEAAAENTGTKMVLALQNNLKLFYRPEGVVKMDSEERAKQLQFYRKGNQLTINNPTPYYITLSEVSIASIPISLEERRMLAPFSSENYTLTASTGNQVSWQIIDDGGRKTPEQTKRLDNTL